IFLFFSPLPLLPAVVGMAAFFTGVVISVPNPKGPRRDSGFGFAVGTGGAWRTRLDRIEPAARPFGTFARAMCWEELKLNDRFGLASGIHTVGCNCVAAVLAAITDTRTSMRRGNAREEVMTGRLIDVARAAYQYPLLIKQLLHAPMVQAPYQ